jgi:hypothetical protein
MLSCDIELKPRAPTREDDMNSQMEHPGAIKGQGILTEEEFATHKDNLLGL